ncbi:MAG: twin-arginine translocase TatA/TatE family subunit [Bacteroidaceae bacterium]|nr:twin-arginine translocase TatA/TatE family subunit [Bacteroidaceae bacterium]MBR4337386.1 twin-arginine translocase TatA/TatE family subunit [Bacteroidaceae bacterium]
MIQPLFLGSIGMPELIIIFIIVLLLFGAKKIPELMNGLGKGVKSFKKGMKEVEDEIEKIDTDISSDSKK